MVHTDVDRLSQFDSVHCRVHCKPRHIPQCSLSKTLPVEMFTVLEAPTVYQRFPQRGSRAACGKRKMPVKIITETSLEQSSRASTGFPNK
jgi:hypothetical protein